MGPITPHAFAALIEALGPFEPRPRLAVAVSGGADSLALAVLADQWARRRDGVVIALIVDHQLRTGSAAEAAATMARLEGRGIAARLLHLHGLERGPGLAARARAARYDALETACGDAGIVHLLLGHHAADQAETVTMRLLGRSGPDGLAGMARVVETTALRRLRPLLATSPASLRATLRAERLEWVEDPSNADPAALRARLRRLRHDAGGDGPVTRAAVKAAAIRAKRRAAAEEARAATLAQRAEMHPEAYALLSPGPIEAEALARLFALLAGASYLPSLERIAAIAAAPRPTTLGGVRVLPAGRLAPGHWLLVREAAAMGPPIPARRGSIWDGRFRLRIDVPGASIGALGVDAARVRQLSRLPAAVLATLPAFRRNGRLIGVPHLNYQGELPQGPDSVVFHPPFPAAGAPFGSGSPAQVGS